MTEEKLGQKMLEFERSQTKIIRTTGDEWVRGKPLRPTLPCDMPTPTPSKVNTSAFKPILNALRKHGPMTSRDLARLFKKSSESICGTVRQAVDAGLIEQTPHARERESKGHMECWLYDISA